MSARGLHLTAPPQASRVDMTLPLRRPGRKALLLPRQQTNWSLFSTGTGSGSNLRARRENVLTSVGLTFGRLIL